MNKKVLLMLILSLFIMSVVAVNVHAVSTDSGKGIGDTLYDVLGWISTDIQLEKIAPGADKPIFFARFLIWLFVFAALFYASKFVFPKNRKVGITSAVVVSIIGVLGIPETLLVGIIRSYGIVISILLIIIPLIGVFFLTREIKEMFKESPRAGYILNALAFWITLILMKNVNEGLKESYNIFQFTQWFGFAFALCEILMLWQIVLLIMSLGGGKGDEIIESDLEDTAEKIKDFFKKSAPADRYELAEFRALKKSTDILKKFDAISGMVMKDNSVAPEDKAKKINEIFERKHKKDLEKELKASLAIEKQLIRIEALQKDFLDDLKTSTDPIAKSLLKRIEPQLKKLQSDTVKILAEVEAAIKQVENSNYTKAISNLRAASVLDLNIIKDTKRLNVLIKEAKKYTK